MTTYLLDANVFIEGSKRYYGFEICPGFWEWLDVSAVADPRAGTCCVALRTTQR